MNVTQRDVKLDRKSRKKCNFVVLDDKPIHYFLVGWVLAKEQTADAETIGRG